MKPTNYASQLRGHNKKYQQDTISILKTDFKLIVNKESNPIPSLYKLFFKTRLKKPEFRSLKPIQILESFHPDTQIYINKGRAKSVRKLGLTSYTEMIKYSKDIEIQGKDRIHNCDTHFDKIQLISDFVKSHRNFIKTMHELNAIDPQNTSE